MTIKGLLRAITFTRMQRLSKELGLQARSPRSFVAETILNYCEETGLNVDGILSRWPAILQEMV